MGNLESLSEKNRFLIKNAEIGYQSAAELLSWWKETENSGVLRKIPAYPKYIPELNYFYGAPTLSGKATTAMGCFWKSRFSPKISPSASSASGFVSFIHKNFLKGCLWKHPDGLPGGFEFKPLLYKRTSDGEYGIFPETEDLDLAAIRKKYEWVIMEAVVNDFFRNVPGLKLGPRMLSKMPVMASYVLVHKDYFTSLHPPEPGALAECCFGYSFLPCAVTKTIFGYGPGEFKAAVKQFRFIQMESGEIEIQMSFLVSPRSEKILSLRGFDPVYSLVNVANAVTLNLLKIRQRAHDKMDFFQLDVHARVYQSLLDGMRSIWEDQDWRDKSPDKSAAEPKTPEHSEV